MPFRRHKAVYRGRGLPVNHRGLPDDRSLHRVPPDEDEEDENAQSLSGMDNLRRLIKEYKELKKNNVRHLRFDVAANTSTYGETVSTIIQL